MNEFAVREFPVGSTGADSLRRVDGNTAQALLSNEYTLVNNKRNFYLNNGPLTIERDAV